MAQSHRPKGDYGSGTAARMFVRVHKLLTPAVFENMERRAICLASFLVLVLSKRPCTCAFGFVFVGLAVVAHTAHSEESSFAILPH